MVSVLVILLAVASFPATLARNTATGVCFVAVGKRQCHLSRSTFGSPQSATKNSKDNRGVANEDSADFPGGVSFRGAGLPRLDLLPEDIPPLLMEALQNNFDDSGLKSMWEFAGGNTHYIFENNQTDFISSAHQTADEFPTSFYGAAMYGQSWEMETPLNRVGGPTGWIATQVMKTISSDGRLRRWQWELRKNRRPPGLGIWLVESIGSSDRKGNFEAEGDC